MGALKSRFDSFLLFVQFGGAVRPFGVRAVYMYIVKKNQLVGVQFQKIAEPDERGG